MMYMLLHSLPVDSFMTELILIEVFVDNGDSSISIDSIIKCFQAYRRNYTYNFWVFAICM
jgi:hypothetical protein